MYILARGTSPARWVRVLLRALSVLVVLAMPGLVRSQSPGLNLSTGSGLPGQTVTLNLSLTGGSNVAALQWRMNHSPSAVSFAGAQASSQATQAGKSVQCAGNGGETTCLLFGLNTQSIGSGVVALVTFQIAGGASPGAAAVGLSNLVAASPDAAALAMGGSGSAINVQQVANLPPSASDSGLTTKENTPVSVMLTATDPEGGPLTYSYTQPSNGAVAGAAPALVYTPNPNFDGQDQFTFQAKDNQGQSDSATVTVTVQAGNDPPNATDQNLTTFRDMPLAVTLAAIDPNGDTLNYQIESGPSHGVLSGTGSGLTYTPENGFIGGDSFVFRATDPDGAFDSAVVTIVVEAEEVESENGLSLSSGSGFAGSSVTLDISLAGNSSIAALQWRMNYASSAFVFTGAQPGASATQAGKSVECHSNGGETACVVFGLNTKSIGSGVVALVTFQILGGASPGAAGVSLSNLVAASPDASALPINGAGGAINVQQVANLPPSASDSGVSTSKNTPLNIMLVATDPEGGPLTYSYTQPLNGSVMGAAPTLVYTPNPNFGGQDQFTFQATDNQGQSDSATVIVTVLAGNSSPSAKDQNLTTMEDTDLPVVLSGTDADGDPLTYMVQTGPSNGALTGAAPNLTYIPNQDFHGVDGFTFGVADGNGHSDSGTVGISVNPVNDAPTTGDVQVETQPGVGIEIHLEGNDADDDPLTFTVQINPSSGTLSGSAPDLTYTPSANFVGTDSFDFLVADTGGESAGGTVNITVTDALMRRDKPAVYSGGTWMIDQNADGQFSGPPKDREFEFSASGDGTPVAGDWNGSGQAQAGLFVNGVWYLDFNANGVWDGPGVDLLCSIGKAGDSPVVGDWDGSGRDKIGVFRDGTWTLDWNGNGLWDGTVADRKFSFGGVGDSPVVGDWAGGGSDRIGIFDEGSWELDWNGNGTWDGANVDRFISLGRRGDTPVIGDWNGSGGDKVGAYRRSRSRSYWYLDWNGDGVWAGWGTERRVRWGSSDDVPVVGDWDGSGTTKIGAFGDGVWQLDYNGNGLWDGESVDRSLLMGQPGSKPVVGSW